MDANEFRVAGKMMVDFIADHFETIRSRPVLPSVEPFYMQHLIPDRAPEDGESFDRIFADIERVIMPGVSVCGRRDSLRVAAVCKARAWTATSRSQCHPFRSSTVTDELRVTPFHKLSSVAAKISQSRTVA